MESQESNLRTAIRLLVTNTITPRNVNKEQLKASLTEIELNAANGLQCNDLEMLAQYVVFYNGYDITTRRKLLFSLIPADSNFPYKILPIAISNATLVPVNPSWQYSVLSWLNGLLEYCIIDAQNPLMHICYTSIFNLVFHLNLVQLACRILGHLTRREDVTHARAMHLLHLKEKPGFFEKVSELLRRYQLFRPDLVVGRLSSRHLSYQVPRRIKESLLAHRIRMQETSEKELFSEKDDIWPKMSRAEQINPYQRPTAIPMPDNTHYAETVEEKTEKVIFVSQYKRFAELVDGMEHFRQWKWPNNPAVHLRCPIIIPLFRPNDVTALIGVTNWLQLALRTELIEGIGNPSYERREKLLKAALSLAKVTGGYIPVINEFMRDYMIVWDQNSHFETVLSLLEHVTYTTPDYVSSTLLKIMRELLNWASMVKWCRVVESITNTIVNWAIRSHEESALKALHRWPATSNEPVDAAIIGFWFLIHEMEQSFQIAIMEFECHQMIIHQILDFYVKAHMYVEELRLPGVFLPGCPIVFAVITHGDLASIHRLGKLLSRTQEAATRVKAMRTVNPEVHVQVECLSMFGSFNLSVKLYCLSIWKGSAFSKNIREMIDRFYPGGNLQKRLKIGSFKRYASITQALPYLPFYAERIVNEPEKQQAGEKNQDLEKEVLEALTNAGFYGIEECINTYSKN